MWMNKTIILELIVYGYAYFNPHPRMGMKRQAGENVRKAQSEFQPHTPAWGNNVSFLVSP